MLVLVTIQETNVSKHSFHLVSALNMDRVFIPSLAYVGMVPTFSFLTPNY